MAVAAARIGGGRRATVAAAAFIAPLVQWRRPPLALAWSLRRWPAAKLVRDC